MNHVLNTKLAIKLVKKHSGDSYCFLNGQRLRLFELCNVVDDYQNVVSTLGTLRRADDIYSDVLNDSPV